MMEKELRLIRTIYQNRRMQIDFFTYFPKVFYRNQSYTVSYNPILMIRWNNPDSMDQVIKGNSFKITPKNHMKVLRKLNNVLSWFYDKDMKDLFLIDNENKLIFNGDYKHLKEIIGDPKKDNCVMKIIPSTVCVQEEEIVEGVLVFINKENYMFPLTLDELSSIVMILKDFSYQNELNSLLTSIQVAERLKCVETDPLRWKDSMRFSGIRSNAQRGVDIKTPFDTK